MNFSTLMIAFALLLASCGGEEPRGAPETPTSGELRFRAIEDSTEETPHSTETTSRTWSFTCEICGSTMTCEEEAPSEETEIALIYQSPSSSDCLQRPHDWRSGISRAHVPPLPDGTLVLVKRGRASGAFVLDHQIAMPEKAEYRWWFRTDGGTSLDASSPAVTSGSSECNVDSDPEAQITFGPFRVSWSGSREGSGYIYYSSNPGGPVSAGAVLICVTDVKEIVGIDAADSKWVFKGSPVQ